LNFVPASISRAAGNRSETAARGKKSRKMRRAAKNRVVERRWPSALLECLGVLSLLDNDDVIPRAAYASIIMEMRSGRFRNVQFSAERSSSGRRRNLPWLIETHSRLYIAVFVLCPINTTFRASTKYSRRSYFISK